MVALDDGVQILEQELVERIRMRAPGEPDAGEPLDIAIVTVNADSDIAGLIRAYRARVKPAGAIWLFTPKRGRPGYIRGEDLIPIGLSEGVVDNKVCSVSDTVSGMRFVIRKVDRT